MKKKSAPPRRPRANASRAGLEERLARLFTTIPLDVQREGLSLASLQASLHARGRGNSRRHVGELGDALNDGGTGAGPTGSRRSGFRACRSSK